MLFRSRSGPCGRELCCAIWHINFVTVSTSAARIQDISTNPLKLAGQCAKIKCCINYEVPVYKDALRELPPSNMVLSTLEGDFYHIKTDVFKGIMTYASSPNSNANITSVPVERVREIIAINNQGQKVPSLLSKDDSVNGNGVKEIDYQNVIGQDSLTRFDKDNSKRKSSSGKRRSKPSRDRSNNRQKEKSQNENPRKTDTNKQSGQQ